MPAEFTPFQTREGAMFSLVARGELGEVPSSYVVFFTTTWNPARFISTTFDSSMLQFWV